MGEPADDVDALPERLERLENLGELEAGTGGRRRPLVHRRAVWHVEAGEACFRRRRRAANRRLRRRHRIEERQCDDRACPPEKRSTRQVFLEDEHVVALYLTAFVRIWNCGVLTACRINADSRYCCGAAPLTMARTAGMSSGRIGRPTARSEERRVGKV